MPLHKLQLVCDDTIVRLGSYLFSWNIMLSRDFPKCFRFYFPSLFLRRMECVAARGRLHMTIESKSDSAWLSLDKYMFECCVINVTVHETTMGKKTLWFFEKIKIKYKVIFTQWCDVSCSVVWLSCKLLLLILTFYTTMVLTSTRYIDYQW